MDINQYGFIITRHVNSERTNKYWNNCIKCIRKLYPLRKIVVIDDNSNQNLVKAELNYTNVEYIQSEFPGAGEFLPYYYFLKNKFFDNAVIIHDSTFFHKRVNFENFNKINALPLWHFPPDTENLSNSIRITRDLKNRHYAQDILSLNTINFNLAIQKKWTAGMFGVQSYVNHNFLKYVDIKYNICSMIKYIKCRKDRCCMERIMACLFCIESNQTRKMKSIFGSIFAHQKWGYSYEQYETHKKLKLPLKPIVKVWTGR